MLTMESYIIFSILLLFVGEIICLDPLVLTKNGLVRGVEADDGKHASFLGIPYAAVNPSNPFGHSIEVPRFEETFIATDDSVICPQQDDLDLSIVGSLDCLTVNVYVPDEATSLNRLPVMVWIHGGGFRRWSSNRNSYGPKFLVRMGVVLVTFNYRLGPYGFMSLNTTDVPGNAGLRDQLKALEWVKNNIAAFDGDENNITLFGESAGAASVEFHMLSGYSEGLFHKAIMQSGTVLCDWVMKEPDFNSPIKLAGYMGFETIDVDEALNYLSQSHPHDVIKATIAIGYAESYKVAVEHKFEDVKTMVKDKPSNLLKDASITIPIVIGFNSKEQQRLLYNYLQSPDDYFETSRRAFRPKIEEYFNLDDEELATAENLVRHFYIGSDEVGANTVDEMLDFDSDIAFLYPSLRASRYYLQGSAAPVYLYVFDYAGERNYMKYRLNMTALPGAVHADEIGYLFHQSYYNFPIPATDNLIIDRMTSMWTDFAKSSNPTPKASELIPFTWRTSKAEPEYAVIDTAMRMAQHPYFRRMAFWDAFFAIYGEKQRW